CNRRYRCVPPAVSSTTTGTNPPTAAPMLTVPVQFVVNVLFAIVVQSARLLEACTLYTASAMPWPCGAPVAGTRKCNSAWPLAFTVTNGVPAAPSPPLGSAGSMPRPNSTSAATPSLSSSLVTLTAPWRALQPLYVSERGVKPPGWPPFSALARHVSRSPQTFALV